MPTQQRFDRDQALRVVAVRHALEALSDSEVFGVLDVGSGLDRKQPRLGGTQAVRRGNSVA